MRVKLDKTQCEFLKTNLAREREDLFKYISDIPEAEKIIFEINEDVADDIREWAADKLVLSGFDINYVPNNEGVILVELIDKFYIGNK